MAACAPPPTAAEQMAAEQMAAEPYRMNWKSMDAYSLSGRLEWNSTCVQPSSAWQWDGKNPGRPAIPAPVPLDHDRIQSKDWHGCNHPAIQSELFEIEFRTCHRGPVRMGLAQVNNELIKVHPRTIEVITCAWNTSLCSVTYQKCTASCRQYVETCDCIWHLSEMKIWERN
jgi:hypothetical protein